jgi:ketosteroid isomerase-like protein
MRIGRWAGFVLLLSVPVHAGAGQAPASGPLEDADRAFAAALTQHDRAAFVALLAPDAESTLPTAKRGPEAIANSWLPFLVDPGTTMMLTTTAVVTAPGSGVGTSTGTFAIRGRTATGVQTVPGGTYSLSWRLIDGRWKIAAISGGGKDAARPAADRGGVGPFTFGMTRDEISRVRECQPYTPVAVTGGLECPHFQFDGREMNISFIFGGEHLRRIQLWYYEGESATEASAALAQLLEFMRRTAGSLSVTARPDLPATAEAVLGALGKGPTPRAREIVHVEICGPRNGSVYWFARVGRHAYGYAVMLFADSTRPPDASPQP